MNRSIFKLVYDINLEHRRCNSLIEDVIWESRSNCHGIGWLNNSQSEPFPFDRGSWHCGLIVRLLM